MARGWKRGRKLKVQSLRTGPNSSDRPKVVRSMDGILGITELKVNADEEELVSNQEPIEVSIEEWVEKAEQLEQDISCGKLVSPLIRKSNGNTKIDETVKSDEQELESIRITEDDIEDEVNY